jgi:hypothetical protein
MSCMIWYVNDAKRVCDKCLMDLWELRVSTCWTWETFSSVQTDLFHYLSRHLYFQIYGTGLIIIDLYDVCLQSYFLQKSCWFWKTLLVKTCSTVCDTMAMSEGIGWYNRHVTWLWVKGQDDTTHVKLPTLMSVIFPVVCFFPRSTIQK